MTPTRESRESRALEVAAAFFRSIEAIRCTDHNCAACFMRLEAREAALQIRVILSSPGGDEHDQIQERRNLGDHADVGDNPERVRPSAGEPMVGPVPLPGAPPSSAGGGGVSVGHAAEAVEGTQPRMGDAPSESVGNATSVRGVAKGDAGASVIRAGPLDSAARNIPSAGGSSAERGYQESPPPLSSLATKLDSRLPRPPAADRSSSALSFVEVRLWKQGRNMLEHDPDESMGIGISEHWSLSSLVDFVRRNIEIHWRGECDCQNETADGDKSAETRAEAGTLRCGQTAPPPAPSYPPDAEAVCAYCRGHGGHRTMPGAERTWDVCLHCHGTGRVRLPPTETGREGS